MWLQADTAPNTRAFCDSIASHRDRIVICGQTCASLAKACRLVDRCDSSRTGSSSQNLYMTCMHLTRRPVSRGLSTSDAPRDAPLARRTLWPPRPQVTYPRDAASPSPNICAAFPSRQFQASSQGPARAAAKQWTTCCPMDPVLSTVHALPHTTLSRCPVRSGSIQSRRDRVEAPCAPCAVRQP